MASKKNALKIKHTTWKPTRKNAAVETFLARPAIDEGAEAAAVKILHAVRREGDAGVLRFARRFDSPGLTADRLRVSPEEIAAAKGQVDRVFKKAAREADRRIYRFAREGRRRDWSMRAPRGGRLGEKFMPFDRVGVYIPGGTAPLVSTSLMTASIARAAGVPEIVACTPAGRDGTVNPYILYAMDLAGVTEIYRIGGAQAIGAMAYGTECVRPVQKIVGPGNAYVTAAKKLVYGTVSLDSVAGPSEIAILADDSARPAHIAADLLSQAEHGTGLEKALLVTTARDLIPAITAELRKQLARLSRSEMTTRVLEQGLLLVSVDSLDEGIALINRFAAEHLELLTRDARRLVKKITAAGAIFVGHWTPESAGDFAAGPSHVLPTGGAAARFSGLSVDDFQRRSSVIELTRADLEDVLPVIEQFGRVEGLDGHVRSATIRFDEDA